MGRTIAAEVHAPWLQTNNSRVANRRGQEWGGLAPYRRKSLLRATEHALGRSRAQKKPTPSSTAAEARRGALFRIQLLSEMHLRTRTCVSP